MTLADASARSRALCSDTSFCVSAPAGSGKTALLVQRFLTLLVRVRAPESVVAITFTRKAAAEMRARIVAALAGAASAGDGDRERDRAPPGEHEQRLLALARAVLAHDAKNDWGLLRNPGRLRIQTIDSFCGELTRQMPVLSGSGGGLTTTDDSRPLYRTAIEEFLQRELQSDAPARQEDLARVLLHLDNNWESTVELFGRLLQRREQWQPVFGGAGLGHDAKRGLKSMLQALIDHRLNELRQRLEPLLPALESAMTIRFQNLGGAEAFSSASTALAPWQDLAALLLKVDGNWRSSVTKRDGFPAGKGLAAENKQAVVDVLQILCDQNDVMLLEALRQLGRFPDGDADPEHWEILAALTRMLPRLGAALLLVFQRRGEVDHPQIALGALAALGDDAAPTDIALRLDHRIEHLLVDEFQDTSSLQFELIRRLTRGWHEHNVTNPGAARTLFLVGDPMQSIYGFREANVGLFIQARDQGLGDLRLEPVELQVNFRSRGGLVGWVNETFEPAMPPEDDAQRGAVRLRQAAWARPGGTAPELAVFAGDGAQDAEMAALCARVAEGMADAQVKSMAILGRSRTQLRPVLAALREQGIAFVARDLDSLEQRPLVRDLVSLCVVLGDHFDRFAWLCLLRSPPLALNHADLLHMALEAPVAAAVLGDKDEGRARLAGLSAPGLERVLHLAAVLRWAQQYRDRLAPRVWIEECWLRLGAPACLETSADSSDAEQFFRLVETLHREGRGLDARTLQEAVQALYASPGDDRSKLEVMTLHKAKGLEFDWVFIPALARSTANHDQELLLWDEFALPGDGSAFLLDVRSNADAAKAPRLYDYLKAQAQQKRRYEATRLFYVGCTRAADKLWLGASLSWDEKKAEPRPPPAGSLLASIWPGLEATLDLQPLHSPVLDTTAASPRYRRLVELPTLRPDPAPAPAQMQMPSDNRLARAQGTAIHRCLESLLYRDVLPREPDTALHELLRFALRAAGIDETSLAEQVALGEDTLARCLSDPWLRWSLAPERAERSAELPLTLAQQGEARMLILDYVFVDTNANERWVVDYKTAAPAAGEDTALFMARQLAIYAPQLASYEAALAARFPQPVRCALYFTALAAPAVWQGSG